MFPNKSPQNTFLYFAKKAKGIYH